MKRRWCSLRASALKTVAKCELKKLNPVRIYRREEKAAYDAVGPRRAGSANGMKNLHGTLWKACCGVTSALIALASILQAA